MTLSELAQIGEAWPVGVGVILLIVWFGTLDNRTRNNSRRLTALEVKDGKIDVIDKKVERIDAKLSVLLSNYDGKQ